MRPTTPEDAPAPDYGPLRPLTPEECARLSAATQDLPYTLSTTDAEQIEEDLHGKALQYGTPAEAITAMERRVREMLEEKAKILNTLDDCPGHLRTELLKDLDQLNQTIEDTRTRLDAYRFQQRNEN